MAMSCIPLCMESLPNISSDTPHVSMLTTTTLLTLLVSTTIAVVSPRIGSLMLLTVWGLLSFLAELPDTLLTMLYPLFMPAPDASIAPLLAAVLLVSYEHTALGVAIAVCVTLVAGFWGRYVTTVYTWELTQPSIALLLGLATLCCALVSLCWKLLGERRRRQFDELLFAQHHANESIANQLHNSICNDLVYVLFMAEQGATPKTTDEDPPSKTAEMDEIRNVATQALVKTRRIITMLEEPYQSTRWRNTLSATGTVNEANSKIDTYYDQLVMLIEQYDHRLETLNCTGATLMTIIREQFSTIPIVVAQCLVECVDELYGNIIKYADPNGGYCVSMVMMDDGLQIETVNRIRADKQVPDGSQQSAGHPVGSANSGTAIASIAVSADSGTRRIQERLQTVNGTLTTECTNLGQYVVTMTIPINNGQ